MPIPAFEPRLEWISSLVTEVRTNCFRNANAVCREFPHYFHPTSLAAAKQALMYHTDSNMLLHFELVNEAKERGHAWVLAYNCRTDSWAMVQSFQTWQSLDARLMDAVHRCQLVAALHCLQRDRDACERQKFGQQTLQPLVQALRVAAPLTLEGDYTLKVRMAKAHTSLVARLLSLVWNDRHRPFTLFLLFGWLGVFVGWQAHLIVARLRRRKALWAARLLIGGVERRSSS